MRDARGMTIKSINLHSCSTSDCRALTSNVYCKKCIDKQKIVRLSELLSNTAQFGIVAAELIDRQIYGIGPITPVTSPVGILS